MPEKFEPKIPEQPKSEAETKKEQREHVGPLAEAKEESSSVKKEELGEEVKEQIFTDRLSILKIRQEELKPGDIEKLKNINEEIEAADAPWVVRVMDEIKRKGGEEYLLEHFWPKDVEILRKMGQEKGYDLAKEGIVSGQAKELASALMRNKEQYEKWRETLGTRTRERIEKVGEEPKKERAADQVPAKELFPEVKEMQAVEEKREKTHEEIFRRLVENPLQALAIFKKGVGLKLERAVRDSVTFWEKSGAKALKGASWTGEKAIGYPAGELNKTVWTIREFFEARPGIKRLDNVLKIHAQIERLNRGELSPEQWAQLEKLLKLHKHAAMGQWEEIGAFNTWREKKNDTLNALRTFGQAREKLSGWIARKKEEGETKKEQAAARKAREIAEKLK